MKTFWKHIAFGGAALMACSCARAATYYGGPTTTAGGLDKIVKWYTNSGLTASANPQPVPTANDGNTYVLLDSAKPTSNITFPEGTFVQMGLADGSKSYALSKSLNSVNWNIPSCKIYGAVLVPNWGSSGNLAGNYEIFNTGKTFEVGGSSIPDGSVTGIGLTGKFSGASDVRIIIRAYLAWNATAKSGIAKVRFSGDFSEYKGNFFPGAMGVEAGDESMGYCYLRFESATSMGDVSAPRNDAVVLNHRSQIYIAPAVTQSAARGITFGLTPGQHAALRADANENWTLSAPTHGSDGTLRKVGPGTVTLAGGVSVTNIVVAEGRLVLEEGSTFTPGTKLVVKKGASVVVRRAGGVTPFTIEKEPGGTVSYPVEYSNATSTAVPLDVSAQMATNMPEVVGVRLSENLSLPVTNKIKTCVMRFASDCTRQFAPADFSYDNDKVFNLPGTTFSVEKDKEGRQCIYLNVKVARGQENGNWGVVTNPKTWSGNLDTEKAGEDYYMISGVSTKSATSMKNAYACDPYNFAGDSFSMMGSTTTQATLTDVSRILTIKLRMGYNSYLNLAQSSQGNIGPSIVINGLAWNRPRTLYGTIFIDGSATLAKPAKIYSQLTTNRCQISSAISGPGVLLLQTQATSDPWQSGYASAQTPTPFALYGNNSGFTGQLVIRPNGPTTYARYLVKNASAFGGEPESARADAVLLDGTQATDKLIQIEAESSIDVAAVNRGWSVTYATFRSPSGVTFKFRSPLTLKNKLIKGGAGTLEFGPVAMSTPNGSASLVVDEGWLRQIDETSLRNVDVSVASGAGFVADPQAAYGVRAHSITAAERISVKAIPPEGSKAPFKVALCTVPEGNGDLSGSFEFEELDGFVAPVSGLAKQALSGEDAGWVRYTMKFSPPGMTILLR